MLFKPFAMVKKKLILLVTMISMEVLTISCNKKNTGTASTPEPPGPPPATIDSSKYPPYTWQEHWFDHRQLVKRTYFNDNIAVYYDDDVNRSKSTWIYSFTDSVWTYTKNEYGKFGEKDTNNRLFAIFHTNKYGGGHPGTYLAPRHDFRNVIDIGSGADAWEKQSDWELTTIIHEISHIVEGASKGIRESPAFGIWGDSKWAEIFVYDLYDHLGRTAIKNRVYNEWMAGTDSYPRANTAWFRNWFFPIYDQYGKVKVLNKYFELLSAHFPKGYNSEGIRAYTRDMNLGEFVHFWSGAAGVDLSFRAQMAFGAKDRNSANWQPQFEKAKADFPGITYTTDPTYGTNLSQGASVEVNKENEGGPNSIEGSFRLIDRDNNTKFFVKGFPSGFYALQTLPAPTVANAYILTSGNDAPDRDPRSWVVEGSQDKADWTLLDTSTNQVFTYRNDISIFDFNNTVPYKYYRLRVTATAGSADMQLSEWLLLKK